jgi:phosphonate transport system substrate-binding protein
MSHKNPLFFALTLMLLLLLIVPLVAQDSEMATTITIGKIGDNPLEEIEEYQPLADYLATNLSDFGIELGMVHVTSDIETMAEMMVTGNVNIFVDSAWPALAIVEQSGADIVLRRIKSGDEEKHAIFFTTTDSGVTSINELQGQVIAVEEPDSTSGFMLPIAYLVETGLHPTEVDDRHADVAADRIGYVFSGDDDNTLEWVRRGLVSAGVVDNEAYEEFTEENPDTLVVLAETEAISRDQLVVTNPEMDPAMLTAITQLLTDIDELELAEEILPPKTSSFDAFAGDAVPALLRLQAMFDAVGE